MAIVKCRLIKSNSLMTMSASECSNERLNGACETGDCQRSPEQSPGGKKITENCACAN